MRLFLKLLAFLVVAIIVLVVVVTQFISEDDIVAQVSAKVEQATGRVLSVDGSKDLKIFPSLSLVLGDVRFANSETGTKPDMMNISELKIHISWMSLIDRELSIDKFVITNPQILLETDSNGKGNWSFLPETVPVEDEPQSSGNDGMELPEGFDVSLGQVEVVGGTLTYIDGVTHQKTMVNDVNVAIALPSLSKPLTVAGKVTYQDQAFSLVTEVTTPMAVIEQKDFSLTLALSSDLGNVNYQGEVLQQNQSGQTFSGELSAVVPSVKQLLAWQGISLEAKPEAFNQMSLDSKVNFYNNELTLNALTFALDELNVTGQSTITLGDKPSITAEVDLGELDLNPYLPEKEDDESSKTAKSQEDEKQGKPEPIVWDDTNIDLSGLNAANVVLNVRSSMLKVNDVTLGKNQLSVVLKDAVANIELKEFEAYQGNGKGIITVDGRAAPYKVDTKFSLEGVNAEPLLIDAAGFDKLVGTGNFELALNTLGNSQKSFVDALNGDLSFAFTDGAVKGFNLAAIARSAQGLLQGDMAAVNLDKDFSDSEKTDFAALTGSFKVVNGKATSDDISLVNPFIRVAGDGYVDLPKTKVNMKVKTTLVASTQGQEAGDDSSGIVIPIKIKGSFEDIKVKPDVVGEKTKELKDKLKDKFKGLFGN